mgnify:CR=1 FL=1
MHQPMSEWLLDQSRTTHRLVLGDARRLDFLPDASVHLIVTSPPYWILKRYNENPGQLGHIEQYEEFLEQLSPEGHLRSHGHLQGGSRAMPLAPLSVGLSGAGPARPIRRWPCHLL